MYMCHYHYNIPVGKNLNYPFWISLVAEDPNQFPDHLVGKGRMCRDASGLHGRVMADVASMNRCISSEHHLFPDDYLQNEFGPVGWYHAAYHPDDLLHNCPVEQFPWVEFRLEENEIQNDHREIFSLDTVKK